MTGASREIDVAVAAESGDDLFSLCLVASDAAAYHFARDPLSALAALAALREIASRNEPRRRQAIQREHVGGDPRVAIHLRPTARRSFSRHAALDSRHGWDIVVALNGK